MHIKKMTITSAAALLIALAPQQMVSAQEINNSNIEVASKMSMQERCGIVFDEMSSPYSLTPASKTFEVYAKVGTNVTLEINGKSTTKKSQDGSVVFNQSELGTNLKTGTAYTLINKDTDGKVLDTIKGKVVDAYKIDISIKHLSDISAHISGKLSKNSNIGVCIDGNKDDIYWFTFPSGNFKVDLNKLPKLKPGQKVTIFGELHTKLPDGRDNFTASAPKTFTVLKAPEQAKVTTKVTKDTTKLSGTGKAGLTAYAQIGDKYYKTPIDKSGKFTLTIPKQKSGSKISVFIKDKNGADSKRTNITVQSTETSTSTKKTGTVTTNDVRLRKGASTKHKIITSANKNSKVTILDTSNKSWYKVEFKGKTGYMSSKYIKIDKKTTSKSAIVSADNVRVRKGPGTKHSIIATAKFKDKITVLDTSNKSWFKINHKGKIGYMSSDFIQFSK